MTRMTRWNPFRGIIHIDPTADAEHRGPGPHPCWNEPAIAPDMDAELSKADASRLEEKGGAPSHAPASPTAVTPVIATTSVPKP